MTARAARGASPAKRPRRAILAATQRKGLQSQVATAASYDSKFNTLAREMEAIMENDYAIVGSPGDVVEQLHEVATSLTGNRGKTPGQIMENCASFRYSPP
ncbi:MAG TPA: hypothetical protein VND19_11735 [Acetobacteraceae bacterium]|nr:hypothetical protein [Acetobacteraceae bacterium]